MFFTEFHWNSDPAKGDWTSTDTHFILLQAAEEISGRKFVSFTVHCSYIFSDYFLDTVIQAFTDKSAKC